MALLHQVPNQQMLLTAQTGH